MSDIDKVVSLRVRDPEKQTIPDHISMITKVALIFQSEKHVSDWLEQFVRNNTPKPLSKEELRKEVQQEIRKALGLE